MGVLPGPIRVRHPSSDRTTVKESVTSRTMTSTKWSLETKRDEKRLSRRLQARRRRHAIARETIRSLSFSDCSPVQQKCGIIPHVDIPLVCRLRRRLTEYFVFVFFFLSEIHLLGSAVWHERPYSNRTQARVRVSLAWVSLKNLVVSKTVYIFRFIFYESCPLCT